MADGFVQRIAHEGKTLPDRRSFRNRFLFRFDEEQVENCPAHPSQFTKSARHEAGGASLSGDRVNWRIVPRFEEHCGFRSSVTLKIVEWRDARFGTNTVLTCHQKERPTCV